jgi:hypothetical protein
MMSYRFGFLDKKVTYRFSGGQVAPVPEFDGAEKWVALYRNKDGFLYPPTGRCQDIEGKTLPNTERPAHLFHLPASHELRLDCDPPATDRHRAPASLIIHLVAYLHGVCVQFEDWWFDARVPLNKHHNINFSLSKVDFPSLPQPKGNLSFPRTTPEHFLSHAFKTWQTWRKSSQRRFTNLLFMLNRAPSYEWDWEHFIIEYMVLDACYKTAVELDSALKCSTKNPKKRKINCGHDERIERMCEHFGIPQNATLAKEIVILRNDLFHETLWDKAQPGTAVSHSSFLAPYHLRRLNQRLVLALLGYNNDYMRSAWWIMGNCRFGVP